MPRARSTTMLVLAGTKKTTAVGILLACGVTIAACADPAEATPTPDGECLGTSSAALRVCADGPTLTGVDVSYYQGTVDWAKVKGSGRAFAFVRVSDGVDYPDSKFAQNWPATKAAGLVRGAYQFFRPAKDVAAQANLFITKMDAAGGLGPGDLPPVLDLETSSNLPAATVVARANEWLAQIEAHYGVKPIIYTGPSMSSVVGNDFLAYKLWVANYTTECPLMPGGWTKWSFWQNSDKGTIPGIASPCDTDFFNGDAAAMSALTIQEATPPTPPTTNPPAEEQPPSDGYEGETIGAEREPEASASPDPCR